MGSCPEDNHPLDRKKRRDAKQGFLGGGHGWQDWGPSRKRKNGYSWLDKLDEVGNLIRKERGTEEIGNQKHNP